VPNGCAPGAEPQITVVSSRELVAVDADEHSPDQVTRVTCEETEYGIESDTCFT